ncbi:MAG: hypothetical protein P0S95_01955 [Rhabdochlamydiaceae bacterium]|nr:hypothetical protein [Candidatus Amphrikana amoebophyrae]
MSGFFNPAVSATMAVATSFVSCVSSLFVEQKVDSPFSNALGKIVNLAITLPFCSLYDKTEHAQTINTITLVLHASNNSLVDIQSNTGQFHLKKLIFEAIILTGLYQVGASAGFVLTSQTLSSLVISELVSLSNYLSNFNSYNNNFRVN